MMQRVMFCSKLSSSDNPPERTCQDRPTVFSCSTRCLSQLHGEDHVPHVLKLEAREVLNDHKAPSLPVCPRKHRLVHVYLRSLSPFRAKPSDMPRLCTARWPLRSALHLFRLDCKHGGCGDMPATVASRREYDSSRRGGSG